MSSENKWYGIMGSPIVAARVEKCEEMKAYDPKGEYKFNRPEEIEGGYVVRGWLKGAQVLVNGASGALHRSFPTKSAAEAAVKAGISYEGEADDTTPRWYGVETQMGGLEKLHITPKAFTARQQAERWLDNHGFDTESEVDEWMTAKRASAKLMAGFSM